MHYVRAVCVYDIAYAHIPMVNCMQSKRQRHATLKTKLRVGSRVTGKLGMDFTSVQARRAAQEEAARVVKEVRCLALRVCWNLAG